MYIFCNKLHVEYVKKKQKCLNKMLKLSIVMNVVLKKIKSFLENVQIHHDNFIHNRKNRIDNQ